MVSSNVGVLFCLKRLFSEYLNNGGLPEYIAYQTVDYLHTLFENIIYKDIIVRHKLKDERIVKSLLHYVASNVGKNVTYNGLRKLVNLSNANTVAEYCNYFEDSFLCFLINNYSASLKQQYGYAKKIYWIDPGLAKQVGFRISEDRGRMLENVVYLELLRSDKEVYCYQPLKECDFIIKHKNKINTAIQVTVSMKAPNTKNREIAGLLNAMETFNLDTGLILTENDSDAFEITKEKKKFKIEVIPIWQWLLSKDAESKSS